MDYKKELAKALEKAGAKNAQDTIETPPNREMGDFAFPCFLLAKEFKKSPIQIATELKEKIKLPKAFEKTEAKGPYLNFFLNSNMLSKETITEILKQKQKYGFEKKKKGKISVEYCQANPMKAFHIGHVRNICLGESIARIFEASGSKAMRIYYGGDVGSHVSKTIYAYENLPHKAEPKEIHEKGKWLGELYRMGSQEVREKPELEEKMREMVVLLEKGDKKLKEDWKKLRKISLEYFDSIYKDLDVKFDKIILESDVEKEGIKIAKQLLEKGIAKKDEGALLVDLTKYNIEKFLVLKSDGAALYSSKDLALAKMKQEKFKISKNYYVVGSEQSFYFQQLFKTIEIMGEKSKEKYEGIHISYELVRLEGGKMASREGNVITYAELFNTIYEKVFNETKERHPDWNAKKIQETSREITLTSIKFGMLAQDKNKVIVFNWEKATSIEGETGLFVQYSIARANSILKKAGKTGKANYNFAHEKEKDLVAKISEYKEKVKEAANTQSPHKLAHYLLELASAFNSFYHDVPVLKAQESEKNARIALVKATKQVMENGLNLLNITPMEEM